MLKTALIAAALVVAGMAIAPQSFAQTKNTGVQLSRSATINQLKAETRQTKLKCTGGAGHMTCTSKVAWVCPSGWNACSAPAGGTCCTQN